MQKPAVENLVFCPGKSWAGVILRCILRHISWVSAVHVRTVLRPNRSDIGLQRSSTNAWTAIYTTKWSIFLWCAVTVDAGMYSWLVSWMFTGDIRPAVRVIVELDPVHLTATWVLIMGLLLALSCNSTGLNSLTFFIFVHILCKHRKIKWSLFIPVLSIIFAWTQWLD